MNNDAALKLSVKEIFTAAIGMEDSTKRDAYLQDVCGDNDELRQRIERLVASEGQDQGQGLSPLDNMVEAFGPAVTVARPEAINETLGTNDRDVAEPRQIGPYKLLEQIGQGGFGTVYMAEQTAPVRRKVAVKILKPGMDSKEVITRFEAERQALAMMDHPNISRVIDGGTTETGRPYFVMELVRGVPVTEYCDEARLTTDERLELFIDICRAVQHAHQKGIIHRDLKPSNVLVTMHDDKAVPKVIDFGIAKAVNQQLTDRTLFTGYQQMLGTPLYMSPEQAQMSGIDVDTRSDVYSLGVMLYELLTGTTPFDRETMSKANFDDLRRMIREQEPPRPSTRVTTLKAEARTTMADRRRVDQRRVSDELRGELDWIVMKSLEKDRTRRYESASALAADLQRYLDDEPVLACPPSVTYRTSKFIRHHRVFLIAAALILLASVTGTIVSARQAIRAHEAEQQSSANYELARGVVDDMYTQIAEKWLSEKGDATELQREFLGKAMAFYESTANRVSSDPVFDIERMRAKQRVCAMQMKLGEYKAAEAGLKDLIVQCHEKAKENPALHDFAILELNATRSLGSLLASRGEREAGTTQYEQTAVLLQSLTTETKLTEAQKAGLADTAASLCSALQQSDRKDASEAAIQTALRLSQELLNADPGSWDHRMGMAKTLDRQGVQRMWFGDRQKEANAVFLESKEQLEKLFLERPKDKTCRENLAGVYLSLGVLAGWASEKTLAIEYERKGVALAWQLVQDFPTDQAALAVYNTLLGNLYGSLSKSGTADEATSTLNQYREISEKLVDLFPSAIAYLGRYYTATEISIQKSFKEGKQPAALEMAKRLREKVEIVKANVGVVDSEELRNIGNFAIFKHVELLIESSDYREAIKSLEQLDLNQFVFKQEKLDRNTFVHADIRYMNNCINEFSVFHWPVTLIHETLELMESDASLGLLEKKELSKVLEPTSERLKAEANQVLDAWQTRLKSIKLTSGHISGFYMLKVNERDILYKSDRRIHREATLRMAKDLLRKLDELGTNAEPNDLSLMIGELVAGDVFVRDAELALRLAQRALDLSPKNGMAKQDLAWALFANGQYQECLDTLGGNKRIGDPSVGAIIAMCLWHLGQKEKAAEYLNEQYEKELAQYVQKREKEAATGKTVWPTAVNLLRLDSEAKALIGIESESRAAADETRSKPEVEAGSSVR